MEYGGLPFPEGGPYYTVGDGVVAGELGCVCWQ